ncbi:hypothetical protein HDU79_008683 [Rhizoclosmatium sp. JEL0117]|nr:hypothetical protein HDU79_008683 [Rhizoclosmatium sp. JEL0117]
MVPVTEDVLGEEDLEFPEVTLSDYDLDRSNSSVLVPGKIKDSDIRRKLGRNSVASLDNGVIRASSCNGSRNSFDGGSTLPVKKGRPGGLLHHQQVTSRDSITSRDSLGAPIIYKDAGISPSPSIKSKDSHDDILLSKSRRSRSDAHNIAESESSGMDSPSQPRRANQPKKSKSRQISIHSIDGMNPSVGPSPIGSAQSVMTETVAELEQMKALAAQLQAQMMILTEQNKKLTKALEERAMLDRYEPTHGTIRSVELADRYSTSHYSHVRSVESVRSTDTSSLASDRPSKRGSIVPMSVGGSIDIETRNPHDARYSVATTRKEREAVSRATSESPVSKDNVVSTKKESQFSLFKKMFKKKDSK